MTEPAREGRPPRPQAVLTVRTSHWLTPHIVALTVGGPGFAAFRSNEFTDKYVKITFVDPALGLTPPYDLNALRESLPPEQRPVTRTYTVRRVQTDEQQLEIDFVVHGDDGVAGPWAARAQPGDTLTLSGAGGGYAPDPDDDWHLFLGDESALPAISAALEALPGDARGIAYIESQDEHEHDLVAPPGIELNWLHGPHPGATPGLLADALNAGSWLSGRVGIFAHGERESMKAVRASLKNRDLGGGKLSLSGYWAHGRTEDLFQAEKTSTHRADRLSLRRAVLYGSGAAVHAELRTDGQFGPAIRAMNLLRELAGDERERQKDETRWHYPMASSSTGSSPETSLGWS